MDMRRFESPASIETSLTATGGNMRNEEILCCPDKSILGILPHR